MNPMNRFVVCLFFGLFFLLVARPIQAAMLTYTNDGEVYWNVLGLSDSTLEVKKVVDKLVSGAQTAVILSNNQGTVRLSYGKDADKEINLTGYEQDIVEIEGRESAKKIFIRASEGGFLIREGMVTATTAFPIKINSPENKLAVSTSTGERFLAVSPFDAVSQIVRTKIISPFTEDATISLVERPEGEVAYVIDGKKEIQLFNIFLIEVPVTAEVSAVSGNLIDVNQPLWYSVVDFLFA